MKRRRHTNVRKRGGHYDTPYSKGRRVDKIMREKGYEQGSDASGVFLFLTLLAAAFAIAKLLE